MQMSPQVAASYGSSVARLGQTLAQTGQDITRLMEETQRANDRTNLLRAEQEWKKLNLELDVYMDSHRNDPSKWQEKRADIRRKQEAYNDTVDLSRAGRQRLTENWINFSGNDDLRIGKAQHSQIFNNNISELKAARDAAYEIDDFGSAKKYIDELARDLPADQIQQMNSDWERRYDKSLVDEKKDLIAEFPEDEFDDINDPSSGYAGFDRETREMLTDYARGKLAEKSASQVSAFNDTIYEQGGMTTKEFNSRDKSGEFSAVSSATKIKMRESLSRKEPPTADELIKATGLIDELAEMKRSGASEDEYIQRFTEVEGEILAMMPPQYNGWLRQRLNYHNPNYVKKDRDELLAGNRAQLMEDATASASDMLRTGKFGEGLPEMEDPLTGKLVRNPEEGRRMRDVLYRYESWLKQQNENISIKEGREKLGELMGKENVKRTFNVYEAKQKTKRTPRYGRRRTSVTPSPAGTYQKKVDVPVSEGQANVRYNNPAAAYPRKADEKYGVEGYGVIGKRGEHKIAKFPTPVHGAASNFDLFAANYTGMTFKDAVKKWRGEGKTSVPRGYDPDAIIDKDFLNDSDRAMDFFKKMASHEGSKFKMSDDEWLQAWQMWKDNA